MACAACTALTAIAGNMLSAVGKAVDGQHAVVGTAAAAPCNGSECKI